MTKLAVLLLLIMTMTTVSSGSLKKTNPTADSRNDGATKINISLSGSLQNPAFSPDGENIIYSSDEGEEEFANLYSIPVSGGNSTKITNYPAGYDGAPSWSPDGGKIAFVW
jgi:Tol biopolymer transport system component